MAASKHPKNHQLMRISAFVLGLAVLIGCGMGATPVLAQDPIDSGQRKKLALIVAISEYEDRGWRKIHSTNDIALIRQALISHGFKDDDDHIKVLKDDDATITQIRSSVDDWLIPRISAGDVVYFHFSGHGQRITDNNCDESDGFDETLVPHDGPARLRQGYTGDQHLRDDELEKIIDGLRAKAGPAGDVIFAFDSCYSGTVSRGFAPTRGTGETLGAEQQCATTIPTGDLRLNLADDSGLAPYVAISASRFNELAIETDLPNGKYVGSLSLALSSSLQETDAETTYRHLFQKIESHMAARVSNTPQIEGDPDRQIFGGLAVNQENYYEVLSADASLVSIEAGVLRGGLPESVIEFHPPQTSNPAVSQAYCSGTIKEANELISNVDISGMGCGTARLEDAWAFNTMPSFGPLKIRVAVESTDSPWRESVLARLSESKILSADNDAEVSVAVVDARSTDSVVRLQDRKNGELIREIESSDDWPTEINYRLRNVARNRFLRKMELDARGIGAELEIQRCEVECKFNVFRLRNECDCTAVTPVTASPVSGNIELKVGDYYKYKIRNTGTRKIYAYLLVLLSNGDIKLVYPEENSDGETLGRNDEFVIPQLLEMKPPLGTDVYLLVSSLEPINFYPVTTGGKSASRANRNAFDLLMEDTFLMDRGPEPVFPLRSASTATMVVRVVEPPDSGASP